jgi:nucleoside-diphosphate-sugar epimerase
MRVLVTGANGFVGREVVRRSAEAGYDVTPATRENKGLTNERVIGNIDSKTNWKEILSGVDIVIHLAARVHVINDKSFSSLDSFRAVNTQGTLSLANQAAQAGVRRIVFLSSIKVNGEVTEVGKAFSADDTPAPRDPYGQSKWEAEKGLLELSKSSEMEVVIIRPPLVYGPGVKANFLSLLRIVKLGVPLPLGAIHNVRSLVALDNLVDLIIRCMTHPNAKGQVFLVSDGEDLSTTELIKRIASALNKPSRLIPIPSRLLGLGAIAVGKKDVAQRLLKNLQVDIKKTRDLLGWSPKISVDEGLRKSVENFYERQGRKS